jgi:hypothetical protein
VGWKIKAPALALAAQRGEKALGGREETLLDISSSSGGNRQRSGQAFLGEHLN